MRTKLKSFLMLLAVVLLVPQGMKADPVKYDFSLSAYNGNTTTTASQTTVKINNVTCTYYSVLGNVQDPDRFGSQDTGKLRLRNNNGTTGLFLFDVSTSATRIFFVANLKAGDVVTFNGSETFGLNAGSASATAEGNKFTMNASGILAVNVHGNAWIYDVTIDHPAPTLLNTYSYDYSQETYDLTGKSWTISAGDNAGFSYPNGGGPATYISNPSNYELNNRIVFMGNQASQYTYDNGLKNNSNGVRIVSINDLHEGDRVKITYSGTAHFRTSHTVTTNFAAQDKLFLDTQNDGNQNIEEDVLIKANDLVENNAIYTILSPCRLDIGLDKGASIQKIEIISDRECGFVDTPNADGSHTLTFDGTGELKSKSAYIAGLMVEFSNAQKTNEAVHVTASDKGYKSVCEDYEGFKMARRTDLGTNLSKAPDAGTFYKFIPEVDGKLYFSFKTTSVSYGSAITEHNSSNEQITGEQCPYYIIETDASGNTLTPYGDYIHSTPKGNGAWVSPFLNEIQLEANHTYYIYGWWQDESHIEYSCGVANAVSIRFKPDFMIEPLALCVENGTKSATLAKVTGSTPTVHIKKKSSNINVTDSDITIDNDGNLKISNISYASGYDEAGVVLIEVGDGANTPQVFALTIAYSASYNGGKGHIWDFSSNELEIGRYFKDWFSNVGDDGRGYMSNYHQAGENGNTGNDYFDESVLNTSSLLYREMSEEIPDWRLEYARRVVDGENTHYYDPMFVNVYTMEGDNADMIWETEGLWFETAANASCLFNEKIGAIDRTITDQQDPDRYVGIRKGGEFRIPKLKKDDRVIIYMGSAKGSGAEDEEMGGKRTLLFDIENARDAVYQPITDTYWVGGSVWNVYKASSANEHDHNDPNYRGAYHFFAKEDGDMVFRLTEGSLCKIYSIEIYHDGTHHYTNSIQGNNSVYDMWNDNTSGNLTIGANGASNSGLTIHYRGKGEKIAGNGGTIMNEVLTYTGHITNTTINTINNGGFSYTSKVGDFGTMLVRAKVMDYNQKYVTDFGDRNITIGYKEKKAYPYTWDFTDMSLFSGTDVAAENGNYPKSTYANGTSRPDWEDPKIWNLSLWEKAVVKYQENEEGELEPVYQEIDGAPVYKMNIYTPDCSSEGGEQNAYYIFANNKYGGGNELHANGMIIPETQGLMFYMDNNDAAYNGSMKIAADGLHLANTKKMQADGNTNLTMGWWNYKMVVPAVPQNAAVYLRMARDTSVGEEDYSQKPNENPVYFFAKKFQFDWMSTKADMGTERTDICKYYQASDNTGDYIVAIKNTGEESDLTFTLNGWVLKKLSISTDEKTVNKYGWNTESRNHAIDPSLLSYMTGKDFRTYIVTGVSEENKTATLARIDGGSGDDLENTKGKLYVPGATDGSINACIVRYVNEDAAVDAQTVNIFNDNNGFHLFVPDMHDDANARNTSLEGNKLKAQVSNTETSGKKVPRTENGNNNYAFTFKYVKVNGEGGATTDQQEGVQAFYRIVKDGASSKGNQAYLSIPQVIASSRAAVRAEEAAATPESYTLVFKDWYELEGEKGDVNGDGLVNEADMELAKDYVTVRKSNGLFKRMGDMNDDGNVDIVDLTLLIKKIMSE